MQRNAAGWGNGLVGVIIFSASLPATRVAVGGFTPLFLTSARAVIAALLGATMLLALRQRRPAIGDLVPLIIVALGVVVGFPPPDGAGAPAHHLCAFHRVHRPPAARHRHLRRDPGR